MLFETWATQHGDTLNLPGDTFAHMQQRIINGYRALSHFTGHTCAEGVSCGTGYCAYSRCSATCRHKNDDAIAPAGHAFLRVFRVRIVVHLAMITGKLTTCVRVMCKFIFYISLCVCVCVCMCSFFCFLFGIGQKRSGHVRQALRSRQQTSFHARHILSSMPFL